MNDWSVTTISVISADPFKNDSGFAADPGFSADPFAESDPFAGGFGSDKPKTTSSSNNQQVRLFPLIYDS